MYSFDFTWKRVTIILSTFREGKTWDPFSSYLLQQEGEQRICISSDQRSAKAIQASDDDVPFQQRYRHSQRDQTADWRIAEEVTRRRTTFADPSRRKRITRKRRSYLYLRANRCQRVDSQILRRREVNCYDQAPQKKTKTPEEDLDRPSQECTAEAAISTGARRCQERKKPETI